MCDELRLSIMSATSDSDREELSVQLAEHQLKASNAYQSLRNDTELARCNADVHTITFDLQQNLPVTTLTHSSMFYLRQLWLTLAYMCVVQALLPCVYGMSVSQGVDQVRLYHVYFNTCRNSGHKPPSLFAIQIAALSRINDLLLEFTNRSWAVQAD